MTSMNVVLNVTEDDIIVNIDSVPRAITLVGVNILKPITNPFSLNQKNLSI